jgi:hypothetical protein
MKRPLLRGGGREKGSHAHRTAKDIAFCAIVNRPVTLAADRQLLAV